MVKQAIHDGWIRVQFLIALKKRSIIVVNKIKKNKKKLYFLVSCSCIKF